MMRPGAQPSWRRASAVALALSISAITLICALNSVRWVGSPFPGFMVMANRVIASVSLPSWPVARHAEIYHHRVVAVNGHKVSTSADLYDSVRRFPAGTAFTYTLERDGAVAEITLPSRMFTGRDYGVFFVPYVFSGLALALIGMAVRFLKPTAPASRALFVSCLAGGVYVVTAADLYYPHWFFRLHVLGEAFFPAGFIHLALVFPIDHLRRYRRSVLSLPYAVSCVLGAVYEAVLYQPAYSTLYDMCMVYVGVAALIFLARFVWDYRTTNSHLTRQRIRVILVGFVGGLALPVVLFVASGMTGGEVPVNYGTLTAFLFPLSVGYAIVKHDLFEIETLLKRGVFYLALTGTLTVSYLVFLGVLNVALSSSSIALSPVFPLLFTLVVVLLLSPLKDALQKVVDRIFFRLRYDPKKVLERTSAALASTLRLEETLSLVWRTVEDTVGVTKGWIFLRSSDGRIYVAVHPRAGDLPGLRLPEPLVRQLRRRGRALPWPGPVERSHGSAGDGQGHDTLNRLGARLLVPLSFKGDLMGLIVLGDRASGTFFSTDDIDFLSTLANQSALSIANALAYQEIQEFNTVLEKNVAERTQALARANEELQSLLGQREQAYRQLQRSQERLIRAEKMAALGRLTAGIAHEMNTPLGASLTSLKLLADTLREHRAESQERHPEAGRHDALDAEMEKLVRVSQEWVGRAASHIRSLRLHTREVPRNHTLSFSVLRTIEDARLLLAHRLRLSQCTVEVACAETHPVLAGDPGKLGQVITNLIDNAIDAYAEASSDGGKIEIEIKEQPDALELRIIDHGCGVPAEIRERIFDEFFSTKPLGQGTGLGLPISRDIVINCFAGTMSVESTPGRGSTFIVSLPRRTGGSVVAPSRGEERDEPAPRRRARG